MSYPQEKGDTMPTFSPHCFDNFDMDLLALFPALREDALVLQAEQTPVWTFGTGTHGDPTLLSHPTAWNDREELCVAQYWSHEPFLIPDQYGWVVLPGGWMTDTTLWCVSWLAALRDQWGHTLRVYLDTETLPDPPSYNDVFHVLMAHRRGWVTADEQKIRRIEQQILAWVRASLHEGLQICRP
jgi:hypothetical protein